MNRDGHGKVIWSEVSGLVSEVIGHLTALSRNRRVDSMVVSRARAYGAYWVDVVG